MNRETRDKIVSGTDQSDLTTGNACWQTAPRVFEQLVADFGPFDLDLTADQDRRLVEKWFGPSGLDDDALTANWLQHGKTGYSNPPYGPFVQRMLERSVYWSDRGFVSTLLLPMRVTKAFRSFILPYASDLLFCSSRLVFFENGIPRINKKTWQEGGRAVADTALFDSIVVRFDAAAAKRRVGIHVGEWKVPKHVVPYDLDRAVEAMKLAEQEGK